MISIVFKNWFKIYQTIALVIGYTLAQHINWGFWYYPMYFAVINIASYFISWEFLNFYCIYSLSVINYSKIDKEIELQLSDGNIYRQKKYSYCGHCSRRFDMNSSWRKYPSAEKVEHRVLLKFS